MDEPDDDTGVRIWQSTLDALLGKGATYAEAIEGANLILSAHLRKRAEERRRAEPPPPSERGGGSGDS